MPRKIRDLLGDLHKAGFKEKDGKGSHRKLRHPSGILIVISGNLGDDAKPYQRKAVAEALRRVRYESK